VSGNWDGVRLRLGGAAERALAAMLGQRRDQRDDLLGGQVSTESHQIPQVEYIY
jgi:hypothetical protein